MNPKLKILLVEDDLLDAEFFANLVRRSGDFLCEIETSRTLEHTLSSLSQDTADLIVLDLNLPDSRGLATFHEIRKATDIPIVIYSGAGDDASVQEAVASGAQDYIIKGATDTHSLTRAMRFAIERSKGQLTERSLAEKKRELELIHDLQESLLPSVPNHTFRSASASAATFPAERANGDCCDIIPFDESKFLCFVADVSGHGLSASQLMLSTRATIRAIAKFTSEPAEILQTADELLFQSFAHGRFVTLMIAMVDCDAGTATYVSAAHRGYLLRADGEVITLDAMCPPIGVEPLDALELESQVFPLHQDDVLFIATDGLVETRNPEGEFFREERLLAKLREIQKQAPHDIIDQLMNCVRDFRGGDTQEDDITMTCVKYSCESPADT